MTTHPTFPLNNNLTTVSIGAQFGSPHWISDTSTMQSWFCKTSAGMYDSAHFFTCAIAALLVFSFKSFSADGSLNGPGIMCVYVCIFIFKLCRQLETFFSNCASRHKKEKRRNLFRILSERARAHTRKPLSQKRQQRRQQNRNEREVARVSPPFPIRVRKRQRRHN